MASSLRLVKDHSTVHDVMACLIAAFESTVSTPPSLSHYGRFGTFAVAMLQDILLVLLLSSGLIVPSKSWVLPSTQSVSSRTFRHPRVLLHSSGVLDVEFERVNPGENATSNGSISEENLDLLGAVKAKSLLDLSLESDPDFAESRIPFIDYSSTRNEGGTNYIDVKMAFMADLDGAQYGIGTPFDSAVALTLERQVDGSVQYLSPDTDDNEELMQIMAAQLHEQVGTDLQLQRTPRVLTVGGPLDNYTKNWREKLLPDPVEPKDLMDKSDEDLDFFHQFMRAELGDEEYEKTLSEDDDDGELTAELLELFEVPEPWRLERQRGVDERTHGLYTHSGEDV